MSGEASALIQLGAIGAPFGVRGWVKLRSDTDPPERLIEHRVWRLDVNGNMRDYEIEATGKSAGQLTAKLTGIEDRDAAARLRGARICVLRSELPAPGCKEFYRADLIGCEAFALDGRRLGTVGYFVETPAHAVLAIEGCGAEIWVPALPHHIRRVDLEARKIWIDGIDGIAEVESDEGAA
jgi:16S rRNA processing protein RimM